MTKLKKKEGSASFPALLRQLRNHHKCGWAILVLPAALLLLSLVAGASFESAKRMYVAGDIADNNVISDRDILVEDQQATAARKRQVLSLQPPVYDLSMEP